MKKGLVIFCLLCSYASAWAQMKEGKVLYERTIQLQLRMQGADPAMQNNLPRTRTDRFELSFTPAKLLWEALPDMEEPDNNGAPGGPLLMRLGDDELVFTNLETGIVTSKQELAGKNYIVTDTLRKLAWKLTDETKSILGHTARKATAARIGTRNVISMENGEMKRSQVPDTTAVTAWFATDIPVAAGPEFGGQLPGLILELQLAGGRITYQAQEITAKVNTANIKEPKGGKPISAAEFAAERAKLMDEMRRHMPPGRSVRIQAN